jgi:ELWxxDGT repeat protein
MRSRRAAITESSSGLGQWLKAATRPRRYARARQQAPSLLWLEPLEDRLLPSFALRSLDNFVPNLTTSSPSNFTDVNGTAFFIANDGIHGNELWETDGTLAGTFLVKDINPGPANSFAYLLTNVNGTLFFSAAESTHGQELWESNGSAAGTFMVADIRAGGVGSYPLYLTNVNGTLFFAANDGTHGYELWESNGTAAGTSVVQNVDPVFNGLSNNFVNVNGTLFFSAFESTHGLELWESNGTTAGTMLVKDINPGSSGSYPSSLTNVNGTLVFAAKDGIHGAELWRSDGTAAGTAMVDDLYPGSTGSSPAYLTNVGGILFFAADVFPVDTLGSQLFETNGTAAGTQLVTDNGFALHPSQLTNVNGTLFFEGTPGGVNNSMLWQDAPPNVNPLGVAQQILFGAPPGDCTNVAGTLFFAFDDGVHGSELWQSDGTSTGTQMVADIFPGSQGSDPSDLTSIRGSLLFAATTSSRQPWLLPVSTATNTEVASSPSASTYGETVTLTATVQPAMGAPTPTGTVAFKSGNSLVSVVLLDGNGQAQYSTTGLAAGQDTITAVYSGSRIFDASQGDNSAAPQVVNPSVSATALTSSANPSAFGQAITFTATVIGVAPAPGTPTGNVDFTDGATDLTPGGIDLVAGQATFSTTTLAIGTHTIAATYSGDANFGTSQSSANPQAVQQTPASIVINSSANPSVFGQSVTLTATVGAVFPAAGIPTGTVTFAQGATMLATSVTLSAAGRATFPTSALGFGSHLITAIYSGDSNFSAGTSVPTIQAVNPDATTTSVTSSLSQLVFGQAVTFTASVLAALPGSGTPTGTVTFQQGPAVLGAGVLTAAGQATFITTSLSVASHTITAVYGGDNRFAFRGSAATPLVVSVTQASSSTSLSTSPNLSAFGQPVVLTATVTATAPGGGIPAGVVQFKQGTTLLGNAVLNGLGQGLLQTIALPVGSNTVTAVYLGNASFHGNTSAAGIQTVNPDTTITVVKSSLNPAVLGNAVTLTAVVRAGVPGSGTPTGTATFFDSALALGSGTLTAGQATFSTSSLSLGGHIITAVYGGDSHFTGGTSAIFGQVIHSSSKAVLTAAATLSVPTPVPVVSGARPGIVGAIAAHADRPSRVLLPARVDALFAGTHSPNADVVFMRAKAKLPAAEDWLLTP